MSSRASRQSTSMHSTPTPCCSAASRSTRSGSEEAMAFKQFTHCVDFADFKKHWQGSSQSAAAPLFFNAFSHAFVDMFVGAAAGAGIGALFGGVGAIAGAGIGAYIGFSYGFVDGFCDK